MNSAAICLTAAKVAADRASATRTDVEGLAGDLQKLCSSTPRSELAAFVEHSISRIAASPRLAEQGVACSLRCRYGEHGPFTRLLCLSRGLMLEQRKEGHHG